MLDAKQNGRLQKYMDADGAHLEEWVLHLPIKSTRRKSAEFQILPRTSMRRLMRKEGYHHTDQPTLTNKLGDHDMDMQWHVQLYCNAFPMLRSLINVAYLSGRS